MIEATFAGIIPVIRPLGYYDRYPTSVQQTGVNGYWPCFEFQLSIVYDGFAALPPTCSSIPSSDGVGTGASGLVSGQVTDPTATSRRSRHRHRTVPCDHLSQLRVPEAR